MRNKQPLIDVIEARRVGMGWLKFGESIQIDGSTLYRFVNGQRKLSIDLVRDLAKHAISQEDRELFDALLLYALGAEWPEGGNGQ